MVVTIRPKPSYSDNYLAFVKRVDDQSALYIKNLKSGVETQLYLGLDRDLQETNGEHGNTANFAWTPDDKSIVFWAKGHFHSVEVAHGKITQIPVHIKVKKQITPAIRYAVDVAPDRFKVKMARWTQLSPNGKKILFQAVGYLYVKDVKSGKIKRLTKQNKHFEYYPKFSPDGKRVVYTTWSDSQLGAVRVAKLRNGRSTRLTQQPGHYIEPSFSPDGKKILFTKVTGGFLLSGDWSMDPGIYVINAKGGEMRRIVPSGRRPHFSYDSQRIYFINKETSTQLQLKSVDLDGNKQRTHYQGEYITDFQVSPDGKWVAFVQHFNIYIAPLMKIGKGFMIHPIILVKCFLWLN